MLKKFSGTDSRAEGVETLANNYVWHRGEDESIRANQDPTATKRK